MWSIPDELKFVAYAVMHLWLADGDGVREWESAVMRLLTSGDTRAAAVVVGVAHANREQLGTAWWRLLRAGLLWSGLILLAPHHGDGDELGDSDCVQFKHHRNHGGFSGNGRERYGYGAWRGGKLVCDVDE